MDAIDEIVAEFLVESHENLDQLDTDLLALEHDGQSPQLLASIFRTIHTIKGTSGFLGFHVLESVTHVGESLLSRLRDGKIDLTEARAGAMLQLVDAVRGLLTGIERAGVEPETDLSELTSLLESLLVDAAPENVEPVQATSGTTVPDGAGPDKAGPDKAGPDKAGPDKAGPDKAGPDKAGPDKAGPSKAGPSKAGPSKAAPKKPTTGQVGPKKTGSGKAGPENAGPDNSGSDSAGSDSAGSDSAGSDNAGSGNIVPQIGKVLVDAGLASKDAVELARIEQGLGDVRKLGEILVGHGGATVSAVAGALHAQDAKRSVVDSSVRVDVELLDTLMRMVGELVLARNQLVSGLDDQKDTVLARSAQRLSLVTSELQEQVMKTRMQPVDTVWSKLPRVVRDLSQQLGRAVRLEMEGRETELDRSVLEAIKDPLTHLVRNAIDHGFELPAARVAAGKPAEGLLLFRAYHEAGQVHLEIVDDGAGIDPKVIAATALQRGLYTAAALGRMSEREIIQLIFLPGFSTAAVVTNVSGRGVGMDVVKTRIEGIGGSVDVISKKGIGSTFRLTIPLTLAIIPALTIGCAGRRYAVPQVSVLELVRLSGEHARGGIEHISGAPVYRLRGTLLPLVRLDEQLGLIAAGDQVHDMAAPEGTDRGGRAEDGRGGFIVVLQAEQHRFGLVVDDVLDTQEIVVKPLGRHLKGLPMYAGATILGDGSVVLILDATTVARRADVLAAAVGTAVSGVVEDASAIDPILVVELDGGRRAAIPLDMVTRLEEIGTESIERVGGREVVQYRGHIMPMVRLGTLLGAYGGEEENTERVQLVVYTRGGRSVGFAVKQIIDIATERTGSRSDIDDHALLGSVVVGDRVVELLDVQAAVLAADPVFYQEPS